MSSFTEMDERRLAALKAAEREDAMKCPKCGSQWFELKRYRQYRVDFPSLPGDEPTPVTNGIMFFIFECACGEQFEPKTMKVYAGASAKTYDAFLDQFEKSTKMKESK